MKGYKQINVKYANGLYRRPAKQYESDSSMTNEVHDTNLNILVFLNLKKWGIFCHTKQLTPPQKVYIFNALNSFKLDNFLRVTYK